MHHYHCQKLLHPLLQSDVAAPDGKMTTMNVSFFKPGKWTVTLVSSSLFTASTLPSHQLTKYIWPKQSDIQKITNNLPWTSEGIIGQRCRKYPSRIHASTFSPTTQTRFPTPAPPRLRFFAPSFLDKSFGCARRILGAVAPGAPKGTHSCSGVVPATQSHRLNHSISR